MVSKCCYEVLHNDSLQIQIWRNRVRGGWRTAVDDSPAIGPCLVAAESCTCQLSRLSLALRTPLQGVLGWPLRGSSIWEGRFRIVRCRADGVPRRSGHMVACVLPCERTERAVRGSFRSLGPGGLAVPLALVLFLGAGGCTTRDGMWPLARIKKEGDPSLAPYVVTPPDVVEEMLKLAEVRKDDLVYDLGSGDGRIVISAARNYGARGIGFELDPDLVRRARDDARRAGVGDLVGFYVQNVMTVDLAPATVVTLYLSRDANLKLRPGLLSQLRPGSRVVSHDFDMGDWRPDRILRFRDDSGGEHSLFLWRIPERRPSG